MKAVRMVKLKLSRFTRLVKKLKECMRANRELNRQIEAYNQKFAGTKDV